MKPFLSDTFLLESDSAKKLYFDYAAPMPVIDYHCHLPVHEIAENKTFENLTQIWLNGDHYKWRAMRGLGVDEHFVTGDASDRDKFLKWAETVPYTARNPLYHWTHLELKRYFGIEELLDAGSAGDIYERCNSLLQEPEYSTQPLIQKMNVEVICTTDDPVDSLLYHQTLKDDASFKTKVLPAFRPDKTYSFEDVTRYNRYLGQLEEASGITISSVDDLLDALDVRVTYFHKHGCRLADHGLRQIVYRQASAKELNEAFQDVRGGQAISVQQKEILTCHILLELGKMYHQKGWVQQFHLGALRNASKRMAETIGPNTGFDSIGDYPQAPGLAKFLSRLDSNNQLVKTILYNLNPADNEVFATMAGNFNDGSVKGKVQHGSAWWFLDQKNGIEKQLDSLSNMGLLSCFIGMLTDSRSFLSYPRHEYFRRILCNLIGRDIENGELPNDLPWLGKMVSDICYHNAREYFNF